MKKYLFPLFSGLAILATSASAQTASVLSTDDIFDADANLFVGPGSSSNSDGTAPGGIILSGATSIKFTSVTGNISLNGGGNLNNADGIGSASTNDTVGPANALSGITVPNAGALVAVFVNTSTFNSANTAPTSLVFNTGSPGTAFTSLSPALDQVFFIGDGFTGSETAPGAGGDVSSGTDQTFTVPAGATELFLGIEDAGGYNGSPGSYGDNSGTFLATYVATGGTTGVPDTASTLALVVLGCAGLILVAPRRWRKAENLR